MPIKIYGTDKLMKSISFKVGHSGSNLSDLVYGFKTWPNQFGSIVGDNIWNTGTQIVEFSSVGVILVKKQPVDTATIKIQVIGQYNDFWLEK